MRVGQCRTNDNGRPVCKAEALRSIASEVCSIAPRYRASIFVLMEVTPTVIALATQEPFQPGPAGPWRSSLRMFLVRPEGRCLRMTIRFCSWTGVQEAGSILPHLFDTQPAFQLFPSYCPLNAVSEWLALRRWGLSFAAIQLW